MFQIVLISPLNIGRLSPGKRNEDREATVGVKFAFPLGLVFYWSWKASQLETIGINHFIVRSLVWIDWFLCSGFHGAQIKVAAGFSAHSGGWLNSVPCGCRTEAPASLLAVNQGLVLELQGLPTFQMVPSCHGCSNLAHAGISLPSSSVIPLQLKKFSAGKGSSD